MVGDNNFCSMCQLVKLRDLEEFVLAELLVKLELQKSWKYATTLIFFLVESESFFLFAKFYGVNNKEKSNIPCSTATL